MAVFFKDMTRNQGNSRSGMAFIVEMLVLLVFIAACLAVVVEAFAVAHQRGIENSNTVQAVHLASSTAEDFAAEPTAVPEVQIDDDLVVITQVSEQKEARGTLYFATIQVFGVDDQAGEPGVEPYYELETAHYVRAGGN